MGGIRTHEHQEVILLLCQANVARSPLAAAMLRSKLDDVGRSDVLVSSAGIAATPGVSACLEACQVATGHGLDLSGHASEALTRSTLADATLVITMTEAQRAAESRLMPAMISRTFTLPELCRLLSADTHQCATITELAARAHRARPRTAPAETPEDIQDPIGRPLRHYHRMADRMAWMTNHVAARVHPRASIVRV